MANDIKMPWGASGVVVAWSKKPRSRWPLVEWYGDPTAFRAAWPGLLRSVLDPDDMDAKAPWVRLSDVASLLSKLDKPFSSEEHPAGVSATTVRFTRNKMHGWATRVGERLVHVGAVRH
jgi:hypothetical protein